MSTTHSYNTLEAIRTTYLTCGMLLLWGGTTLLAQQNTSPPQQPQETNPRKLLIHFWWIPPSRGSPISDGFTYFSYSPFLNAGVELSYPLHTTAGSTGTLYLGPRLTHTVITRRTSQEPGYIRLRAYSFNIAGRYYLPRKHPFTRPFVGASLGIFYTPENGLIPLLMPWTETLMPAATLTLGVEWQWSPTVGLLLEGGGSTVSLVHVRIALVFTDTQTTPPHPSTPQQ